MPTPSRPPQRACPLPSGAAVVAYARDSGGEDQERSVDSQIAVYQAYARQHGLRLLQIYADRGRPGSTVVGRDAFEQMVTALRRPGTGPDAPAGVLLWKHNRFARNQVESQYYKADLRRRGLTLVFIADDIPDAGDATILFEALLEWKAERDLHDISTDARRGLADLVQMRNGEGNYEGFAPGTPPRGYTRQQVRIGTKRNGQARFVSRWVPDPLTWERVRLAWQMRAAGASLAAIHRATRLYRSEGCYSTFFGNELYRGTFVFGDLRLERFVPPACTPEQWDAVQAIRQETARRLSESGPRHPRRVASGFLLSGILHCAHCGAPMKGKRSGRNGWAGYICTARDRDRDTCPNSKPISAAAVERAVLAYVADTVLTPAVLARLLEHWRQQHTGSAGHRQAEERGLRKQLAKLNVAIRRLADYIEEHHSAAVADRLAAREAERAVLEARLAQLQLRVGAAPPKLTKAQLAAFADRLRQALLAGDPEKVKPILRAVLAKVVADKKSGKVYTTFPLSFLDPPPTRSASVEALLVGVCAWTALPSPSRRTARNLAIQAARQSGATLQALATLHGISVARVHQLARAATSSSPDPHRAPPGSPART